MKNQNNLPSFLVVGCAKGGTTALFHYLNQHPDIYIPRMKECRFFSDIGNRILNPFTKSNQVDITCSLGEYHKLFESGGGKITGDVSPDYLYYHEPSIGNIRRVLGDQVKIIIMLRDPVSRAYSNYLHLRRDQLTDLPLHEYLQLEDTFAEDTTWWGFLIKASGLYAESVKQYINAFPNIKIVFFEDFKNNKELQMKGIFSFLDVDHTLKLTAPAFTNKTGLHKSPLMKKMIDKDWRGKSLLLKVLSTIYPEFSLQKLKEKNLVKPPLNLDDEHFLEDYYYKDVARLEDLLGREIPWSWYKKRKGAQ